MANPLRHTAAARRALVVSTALALTAGCAGAGGGAGAGGALRTSPGTVSGGQFAPARPQAEQYGAGAAACPSHGAITFVMNELTETARSAGRTPPVLDPRVCAVAEAFLGWDAASGAPRPAVLAFVSRWFGLPGVVMPPTTATLDTSDERLIGERIAQAIGNMALNAVHARVGIAVQRVRKGKDVSHRVSVTLVDSPVDLDPLPRRLAAGQQATVSGRLIGVKNPKVLVSDATGKLSTPEQAPGEAFRAELSCGDRPGRIQVEIRAEYEGDEGVVASFPVACAEELPARVAVAPEPWPSDPAAAERRILELVNAERRSAALEPFAWDPAVAAVARSISSDLAARGGVPGGPDVSERLKKQGIASPLVLQSAAAERTFERAHERLMASPSNRANLMSAEVTHAGIGVVSRPDPEGRPIVYVTEVFIRELPPVAVDETRQALRDAVAQKRKDARTNALAPNAGLDEVAQRYAEALAEAGGTLPKERHSELTFPLNKGFRSVTMVSGAKQEPLDFAEEPQTTAPGKALGVGVAQGKHPVLGRNATYVVLMVGTPRR